MRWRARLMAEDFRLMRGEWETWTKLFDEAKVNANKSGMTDENFIEALTNELRVLWILFSQ
jgi:hypothetical protein